MTLKKINHPVWLLVLVCIATRLPQLLNPAIALDGDEAVSAMMVKHMIAGKEFPLYFYGQNYGFSLIESLWCIPLSLIAGVTTFSIKASILSLWTLGIVFFYKTLRTVNTSNSFVPLLIALLLATTPAWAVWSMKARGGYTTAFTATYILTYLLLDKRTAQTLWAYVVSGILLIIILEAKSLWLVATAPVLVYVLFSRFNIKRLLGFSLAAASTWIFFYYYKQTLIDYGPQYVKEIDKLLANITNIPAFLYRHFCGRYYLAEFYPDNLFTAIGAYSFIALIITLVVASVYQVVASKKRDWLFIASVAGFVLLICSTVFSGSVQPRFLLPLAGGVLLSAQLLINHMNVHKLKPVQYAGGILLAVCIIGTLTFYNFNSGRTSRTALKEMVAFLEANNVHYVYTVFAVMDFQVMFYSDERILARNQWYPGRYDEYTKAVDQAFNNKLAVAVVGIPPDYHGMHMKIDRQTNEYYIALHPDRKEAYKVFQWIDSE